MIGFLAGIPKHISEKEILLLTSSGVGYSVIPSGSLLAETKTNQETSFHITTIVREQEITLYGFATREEKQVFEKLLSVSGIGPKMALTIISTPVEQFFRAIEAGDTASLTQIKGLGKKTAERIIIDLRGKIDLSAETNQSKPKSYAEAVDALLQLGYQESHIHQVLKEAPTDAKAEDLLNFFLRSHA